MDSAKAAVKDFMAKAGHHDTTVHEKVAPAVTHETINRTQHEDVQTAVDKEVHQDHYHTSVQPVVDQQQLPEQHHHNIIPVEHRQFEHDNADKVQQRLQTEQAQFRDQQDRVEGEKTHSVAPVVAGEHIHHHVHETIQPVVNKQTIEPHVVHTTVPIHEVHHNATQHHATSALPAVSMGDFKKQGGVLGGREERYDGFQGEPRQIGGSVGNDSSSAMGASGLRGEGTDLAGSNTHSHHSHGNDLTGANTHSHHSHGNDLTGNNTTSSRGVGNDLTGNTNTTNPSHTFGTTEPAAGTHKKPGLMDKLNPKKDTDGDGKAGFMD